MPDIKYPYNKPIDRLLRLVHDRDLNCPAEAKLRHARVLGIESSAPLPDNKPVIVDWTGGSPVYQERRVPNRNVAINFDTPEEHFLWDSSQ
ncbi:MAG TPA: hypothetical protein VIY48_03050 [Candidatus Paceibacterota bacterium]